MAIYYTRNNSETGVILYEAIVFISLLLIFFQLAVNLYRVEMGSIQQLQNATLGSVIQQPPYLSQSTIDNSTLDMVLGSSSNDNTSNMSFSFLSLAENLWNTITNTTIGYSSELIELSERITGIQQIQVSKQYFCVTNTWSISNLSTVKTTLYNEMRNSLYSNSNNQSSQLNKILEGDHDDKIKYPGNDE